MSEARPLESPRGSLIARVERRLGLFPELPFDSFEGTGLEPRDAALMRAIDVAVTRRWLTLVAVLESRIERGWQQVEPALQASLLVGAAQLLFLDRVPDHAAVDESVNQTKRQRGPRAAGFVNAVLRRVAALKVECVDGPDEPFASRRDLVPRSDGRAWRLSEPVFAEDAALRLSQVGSVGRDLLLHWIAAHGFRTAVELARHGLTDPPIVVAGVPDDIAAGPLVVPHESPGSFVFTGEMSELAPLLARAPGMRVQDAASADPVESGRRAGLEPRTVLDLCAGRGTKTVQLAAAFPSARIVATDIDDQRRADLATVAARHASIEVIEPSQAPRLVHQVDLLVLDVPCSNTAVLPRRPEASYRFTVRRLEQLVSTQRDIVAGAMPLLAPGGHLLYATCSLEPSENARQADAARKRHQLDQVSERQRFPTGVPGDPPTRYTDGGYSSLMRARR